MKTRKQIKREAESETVLKVPNTREGKQFLANLRAYKVGGVRVWCRGRGPRAKHAREVFEAVHKDQYEERSRKHREWLAEHTNAERVKEWDEQPRYDGARLYDQDLPLEYAREFAVYIWKPAHRAARAREAAKTSAERYAEWQTWTEKLKQGHASADVQRLERDKVELVRQRDALRIELENARNGRADAEVKRLTADRAELMRQRDLVQATNNRLRDAVRELKQEIAALRIVRKPGQGILN